MKLSASLFAARSHSDGESARLLSRLATGELVLLGGRPGQGKTLLGIGLAIEAMARGHRSAFFTLEFTEADVARCFAVLDADRDAFRDRFLFDDSDGICAAHIISRLSLAPPGTLVVVDYLQLLDQRRSNPPLMDQVRELRRLARERSLIVVCLSQIDRTFDAGAHACPGLGDVRLPNPVDLALFDKACFVNRGQMQLATVN